MNRRSFRSGLAFVLVLGSSGLSPLFAADDDASAVIAKGIKALGGEETLAKAAGFSWKTKGTITVNGTENPITTKVTVAGTDHIRGEFEGEFGENKIKGITILDGDKGWRKFNDMVMELEGDALTTEKRNVYMQTVPITLLPLKTKGFKVKLGAEEKVGDKPAAVLDVTGPDGKPFRLFLDKTTGLPVKLTAKVLGFGGDEAEQETTYADYKEFGGIKRPTKITTKRDGEPFVSSEISDFQALPKVDSGLFAEPK